MPLFFSVKSATPKSARIKLEQPLNHSFISSFKISHKAPPAVGVAVRREPPRGSSATPRLSPAYFRTAAAFDGIRRNSSKTTADLCRTFSSTAEKKKGAHTLFTAPYFAFVRSCRVFTRFFVWSAYRAFPAVVSVEKRFTLYFFFCCNIYSVGLVLWV